MAKFGDGGDLVKCGFCDKSRPEAKYLKAGPGVYICDKCVERFHDDVAQMNKG